MPPKAKAAKPAKKRETIPLICTLCPKHPTFSDTSHLLTHISSKSHLAARFKLQIRSQSEQEARDTLDDFDAWYRNNNLDVLLSDRLAVKEQKKAAKDRKNDENRGLVPIKRAPAKKKELAKKEEELEDDSSVLQKTPAYRAPVPRMALWETHRDGERVGTPTREGWQSASIFETPTAASRVLDDDKSETVVDEGSMLDPRLVTPYKDPVDEADEGKSTDSATRLKGIFWPGMDLFDSATPGMKKKRNQKKESRVMDTMMAFSADVEPNEVSYFADGNFRASRDMFGPLSSVETSPVSQKAPSPKKRRTRKPAMVDLSVNAPRLRAPRRTKTTLMPSPSKKVPAASATLSHDHFNAANFLKPGPTLNPLSSGFGNAFKPTPEEEAEFKLTIGNMKTKFPFSIYQDCLPEESPDRIQTSLGDHRFDFSLNHDVHLSHHGLPANFHNDPLPSSLTSPTPIPRMTTSGIRISGKENGKPEPSNGLHTHRAAPLSTHLFSNQLFYGASFNPLYNHSYASLGLSSYGDPQFNFKDTLKSPGFSSSFSGDFRPTAIVTQNMEAHSKITATSETEDARPHSNSDNDMHFNM